MDDLATAQRAQTRPRVAKSAHTSVFDQVVKMLDVKSTSFVSSPPTGGVRWASLCCIGVLVSASLAAAAPPATPIRLAESVAPGDLSQVKALLEVEGQLKLKPGGSNKEFLPLKITGKFLYDERRLPPAGPDAAPFRAAVRHYHRAEALFDVNQEKQNCVLPETHRLIVVGCRTGANTIGSPHGPLTREHLELIDIPGNSLALAGLLPDEAVAPGERWDVSAETVAGVLGWDQVKDCRVGGTLRSVDEDAASLEYEGTAEGRVSGVATEVELKAKCVFDRRRQRIRWFGAALREDRELSPAEPGFRVTARLQMAIGPLDTSPPLADAALAGLQIAPADMPPPLVLESRYAGCRLLADPRWYVVVDRDDATVLRYVDDGTSVAQCNITSLPDLSPGKHVLLETFRQDIQKTLGSYFAEFVDASQWRTDEGLRVLRVTASGAVSDVTVHWIYFLVSNEKGRRTAVVFTLNQENAERFGAADQTLLSGFEFIDEPEREETRVSDRSPADTTVTE